MIFPEIKLAAGWVLVDGFGEGSGWGEGVAPIGADE
jgi:hypothetical protein